VTRKPDESQDDRHRLDKWLWCARFFKSRAQATDAVAGGRVKVNGERAKPSHAVRLGDRLSLSPGDDTLEIEVLKFPVRRGPAPEAQACYQETPDSAARRAVAREQRRIANLGRLQPDTRPDKRERRQLERFWRNQNGQD
jgi:ribosome-associated heat shock protein Hsp15